MPQVLEKPPLSEGETYIAALTDKAGELYHLILLPGDNDDATHQAQLDLAKSIGGDQFKTDWYWSNETHQSESSWAWYQGFDDGTQNDYPKGTGLRARAVRRLPI